MLLKLVHCLDQFSTIILQQAKSSYSSAKANSSDCNSRGGSARARARAERIFHAVITWNGQHSNGTFGITDWLLEDTFGVNHKAARELAKIFMMRSSHSIIQTSALSKKECTMLERDTSALVAFVRDFSEPT